MNPIECYLLDDEYLANDRLEGLLRMQSGIIVAGKSCSPEKAIKEITQMDPDIVFLDVEMPRISGFDVVSRLKKSGMNSTFIFVTGFDQYAIKAIRIEAFDFLVKPVDVVDLTMALERYRTNRNEVTIPEQWQLSEREEEVLRLVLKGHTSKEIALKLFLSKHTIDTHRRNILAKSGFDTILMLQNNLVA